MVFKKFGNKLRKAKKLGSKVVHHTALGARKMGGVAEKVGMGIQAAGLATGQPEIMAVGKAFEMAGGKTRQVARGVEKIRKGKITDGIELIA